eukprot:CAMPEP_0204116548 /NCGR_PEP_ID=MMETSP0361-20130328/5478_1 /ASSEMBLY_ACC=CAM_ASM_000343 /TAXON_ID=268821 /ORGANISM="Scrippsiella Hangoei, Strain SHTV-5" /LENGTH=52 /DNA_ID=CAMNT_0051067363 /DNA_START=127 /DNA_END=283 /DNA_ORIENTATION=-
MSTPTLVEAPGVDQGLVAAREPIPTKPQCTKPSTCGMARRRMPSEALFDAMA